MNWTSATSRSFRRAVAGAALIVLGLSSAPPAQAAPAARQLNLDYHLTADPQSLTLCVGERKGVQLTLWGAVWTAGSQPPPPRPEPRAWIKVSEERRDREIAEPDRDRDQTSIGPYSGPPYAVFVIKAKKLGTATLTFTADSTGHSEYTAVDPLRVTVRVTNCYEAQVSALATQWEAKDVCDASSPFKLSGSYPGLSSTSTLSFFPDSNDPGRGVYVLVQTAAVICEDKSLGLYTFTEYPQQKKAEIMLSGPSTSWCPNSGAVRTPNVQYAIQLVPKDMSTSVCLQLTPP